MTKYRVIVNPTAGKGSAGKAIPQIEEELKSYNLDFDIVQTDHPWHAAELAQEAVVMGYDVVVSAGGDGTANEILNGLMWSKTNGDVPAAMGVLPIGRGNDFSFSMGIPTDFKEACKVLAEDHKRLIDVGHITGGLYPEGRYFGNGVGLGFDAMVGFIAAELPFGGFAGYLVAALKTMYVYSPAPVMEIKTDQDTMTQGCLMVSIMNGYRMGGGFFMTPKSQPDDGLLSLCVVDEVNKPKILYLISKFLKGTQEGHPNIHMIHAKKLTVHAVKGTLPVHADGETICVAGEDISIEIFPGQIHLVTKTKSE